MLTVITHTRRQNVPQLERAVRSIEAALPPGAEHRIIEASTYDIWRTRRWTDLITSEYTAIVDDDDEIHPDALRLCYQAIQQHQVGVVFTDEVEVSATGQMRNAITGQRNYKDCIDNPRSIHHLCVFRSECIDHDMDSALRQTKGIGVDWMIKASAALTGGALHIPIPGYYWYQQTPTDEQKRETERILYRTQSNRELIKRVARQRWGGRSGMIPQLTPPRLAHHIPEMMR